MNLATIELLHITEDCDKLIERAGRTCYKSEDKITDDSTKAFVDKINKNKHLSVIEHATATFKISNISRALSHQLVRHRIATYSQQSQRYVPAENFDYIIPPSAKQNTEALEIFEDCINKISESYEKLRAYNIPKEDCRYLLPNACCTEIVVTMNFRAWNHFLEERLSKGAQWEIKAMAIGIYFILMNNSCCFDGLDELHTIAHIELSRKCYLIQEFNQDKSIIQMKTVR